jgi:hypothetical protein
VIILAGISPLNAGVAEGVTTSSDPPLLNEQVVEEQLTFVPLKVNAPVMELIELTPAVPDPSTKLGAIS